MLRKTREGYNRDATESEATLSDDMPLHPNGNPTSRLSV